MLALGSVQEVIERQILAGKVEFDIAGFLENVVIADVSNPASPFLLGRCLWIGSKFPGRISIPAMTRFMEATVSGLASDKPAIVRISAVRAVWGFSQHLRASKNRTLLTPFLPAVTDGLINMCGAFNSSSEVLSLILMNLSLVLAVIWIINLLSSIRLPTFSFLVRCKFYGQLREQGVSPHPSHISQI